jgi:outer membrane protein assembly factor BamA
MRRSTIVLCLALASIAVRAEAQEPESPLSRPIWMDVMYPKAFYTLRDGLTVGGYYAIISPLGFADYDQPQAYRASFSLNGQASTSGSREILAEARLPDLFRGWRLVAALGAQRRARENYYGIGNDAPYDGANITDAQPHYYQSLNVRYSARTEIQRQVVGPLRLLAGFHAERWRIDTLPGPSVLRQDLTAGTDPTIARPTNDVSARVGLVIDARDNEVNPRQGALLEAIYSVADSSVAGDLSYTRTTVSAAGYVTIIPQLVAAARVTGESMGGTPRLGSFYRIEASDRPYEGVGGPASDRALEEHRLLGRNKLVANLDLRYDAYAIPTLARVTLLAFLDAGRVFEPDPFKLTTKGMQLGGGGGLFLQFGRAGILGTTLGVGPDGLTLLAHTRWTY